MKGWLPKKLFITLSDLAPEFVPYPPKNLHWRKFKAFDDSIASGAENSMEL
jgi:hypothetical protein